MNKFVTSALALAVAGSLAHAGTSDGEWLELDREIASLAAPAMSPAQGGISWSALLRFYEVYSDDDVATGGPANESVSGAAFADVDIAAEGQVGDFSWRINGDFGDGAGGSFVLEDAYATWNCGDYLNASVGSMKPSILRSANIYPENLLFSNRTVLGSAFDNWDNGVQATGTLEDMFNWSLGAFNGANGTNSDHAWVFRGEYHFGEGAGNAEGALGAGDGLAATVGFSYVNYDDLSGTGGDDTLMAIDFWGTSGPIGFGVEWVDIDEGIGVLATDEDFAAGVASMSFDPDSSPWTATGSYLINEQWEAGARYENIDDALDTTALTLGANFYQSGHNAKYQFSFTNIDSDGADGTIWSVGLVLGSSGGNS